LSEENGAKNVRIVEEKNRDKLNTKKKKKEKKIQLHNSIKIYNEEKKKSKRAGVYHITKKP
jgi:hypothetical protein